MTLEQDKAQRDRDAGARQMAAAERAHFKKMMALWKKSIKAIGQVRRIPMSGVALRKPKVGATRGAGSWKNAGRIPPLLLKIHGGGRAGDSYAQKQKGSELITSNMLGLTPKERDVEFRLDALRHPNSNAKNLFCHVSLSRPNNEGLSNQQWQKVVDSFLKEIGADGSNFVAYRHTNTENDHIHIIFSRAKSDGRLVSMSQNRWAWRAAIRRVEERLGITTSQCTTQTDVPTSDRVVSAQRRAHRLGTNVGFINPKAIEKALAKANTMEDFVNAMKLSGVNVKQSVKNGKATGILFQKNGEKEWFAGSSISREFSLPRVLVRIESHRQASQTLMEQHAIEQRVRQQKAVENRRNGERSEFELRRRNCERDL